WRPGRRGDRIADQPRGDDSRLLDLATIGRAVPAVDAPAGEVDDDVSSVDLLSPFAGMQSVPRDGRPRLGPDVAGDNDNSNASHVEMTRENLPDLPAPAGDNDSLRAQGLGIAPAAIQRASSSGRPDRAKTRTLRCDESSERSAKIRAAAR